MVIVHNLDVINGNFQVLGICIEKYTPVQATKSCSCIILAGLSADEMIITFVIVSLRISAFTWGGGVILWA
jgi:hypothetical protein